MGKKQIIYLSLIIILLLFSCASREKRQLLREQINSVSVATGQMVQDCQFIDELECKTLRGISKCKRKLKIMAARKGATHLVWGHLDTYEGAYHTTTKYLSGLAYKCEDNQ